MPTDTELINWLEKNGLSLIHSDSGRWAVTTWQNSIREAIWDAMKGKG